MGRFETIHMDATGVVRLGMPGFYYETVIGYSCTDVSMPAKTRALPLVDELVDYFHHR